MAGIGLLALMDDISTLLDDISLMTKVAAKKTASVLGDDLALNAEQVSGVHASRELPVVWAVAKGSFINKLILVPLAIAISALLPHTVMWLLMIGGLYLCYEGTEKIAHKWLHGAEAETEHRQQLVQAMKTDAMSLAAYEKSKIKGAIRTDFVLSAEIIVIALGTVQGASLLNQALVVGLIAIVITMAVYTVVAAIVKFDDLGLALMRRAQAGSWGRLQFRLGHGILLLAPKVMYLLTAVGMIAMFLVGGGILIHALPWLHDFSRDVTAEMNNVLTLIVPLVINAIVGLVAGALVLTIVNVINGLRAGNKKGTE